MLNDALESEGKAKKFTSEEEINALPNTDWYDLAYKTGSLQHHNVSVNGATESVNYLASVGYLKQSGILPHAGREQVSWPYQPGDEDQQPPYSPLESRLHQERLYQAFFCIRRWQF